MTKLVEQLRNQAKWYAQPGHNARDLMDSHLLEKAADEIERLRAKIKAIERQEPVGTLHADGCFVWRETAPHQSNYAGWKMALYALPGAKGEEK